MFITKMSLSRRTFLRGMGATLALPLLEAMVPALTAHAQTAANPVTPVRRHLRAARRAARATGRRRRSGADFEFVADPEAARAASAKHMTVVSRAVRPARRPRDDGGGVAERRDSEAHDRRRRARRHHDRPGDRRADRRRHAAPVARAGHRGLHRLDRRLRPGLQLRLHEHDLVEEPHDAAADGDQPARRVRAACSAAPARRRSAWRAWQTDRSILDSVQEDVGDLQQGLGTRDTRRLNDYLDNVREIEQRIQKAEKQATTSSRPCPTRRSASPRRSTSTPSLMFDLLALAYEANITRVVHLHDGARRQPARLPEHRHHRAAPRDVAPRQQPARSWPTW